MPRIARIVGTGYPHHIIQRGNNRQQVFFDDGDRRAYLAFLRRFASENDCRINAYCLMSNHTHLLLVPLKNASLSKTMQKLSLRFTQHINDRYDRTGRLWECRFHSCLIEKETHLWAVCRYIERNPVRAGIVNEPLQYRWSSAEVNAHGEKDGIVEPIWQSHLEREEYLRFLNQPEDEKLRQHISDATTIGRPIGSEKFLQQIGELLGVVSKPRPRGRPRNQRE
jgi:putative transposase